MQHEGLDLLGIHHHAGKNSRVTDGIMEREIIDCSSINRIERNTIVQERGDGGMQRIRRRLHDLTSGRIAHDDIGHYRSFGETIRDGKGKTCLRVKV